MKIPWYFLNCKQNEPAFCNFRFANEEHNRVKISLQHAVLGDFCWNNSGNEILIRRESAKKLKISMPDLEFSPIEVLNSANKKFGNGELEYVLLNIGIVVDHDEVQTSYRLEEGYKTFDGVEERRWDANIANYTRVPRRANAGVFVEQRRLMGKNVFSLRRSPTVYFVTVQFRDEVTKLGLTGADFFEFGDLF